MAWGGQWTFNRLYAQGPLDSQNYRDSRDVLHRNAVDLDLIAISSATKERLLPSTAPAEYDERLKAGSVDDDLWTWFLQSFWHIQYTARPTPLTHELSSCLHNLSVGITHYAVNLFIAAQLLRIGTDKDYLDHDALLQAYATCSKPSLQYLHDLRTNNVLGLRKYTDFVGVNIANIAAAAKAKAELKKKEEAAERLEKLKKIAEEEKKAKASKPKTEPKPKPDPVDSDDLPRANPRDFIES